MPNGGLYYGKSGFKYKKSGGGGTTALKPIGLIIGRPANVDTPFTSGSGVGAHSYSTRRAMIYRATSCGKTGVCNLRNF